MLLFVSMIWIVGYRHKPSDGCIADKFNKNSRGKQKKKVTYASYLLGHFLCIYREAALFLVHELQMLHIDSLLDLLSSLH